MPNFPSFACTKVWNADDGAIVKGALNEWHRIAVTEHPASALAPSPYAGQGCPLPLGRAYALQYQTRDPEGQPLFDWRVCYAFTLNEMHSSDYESLHFAICRRPGLFTQNVLMALHLPPANEGEPMTRLTLFNDRLQEHRLGQDPIKSVFRSEAERIEALQKRFGLGNLREDAEAIVKRKCLSVS